jgi:hypothetical protein
MDLRVGQRIAAPFFPASAGVKAFKSRPGHDVLETQADGYQV